MLEPPDEEEKRTSEGYRTHPFHKPNWEPYPHVNIAAINKKDAGVDHSVADLHTAMQMVVGKKRVDKPTYYRIKAISFPWLIKQIAHFDIFWDVAMYLVIVISCSLVTFSAFYAFFDKELWFWIFILDLVFVVDTLLRLCVEIWRYHARATVVVFSSPYTTLQFILDLVSILPLHQLCFWIGGADELGDLSIMDYFRLNRYIRLSRCVTFFTVMEKRRMADEKILFIFKFANYYLGFILFTSCLLVSCIGVTALDYLLFNKMELLDESFLNHFQERKAGYGSTPWDIFVITTNFATAVITTVGYGDITPRNELEMGISIVCMLVGAIMLNGYFTSEMTNFEVELDGARFDLYYRVAEIRKFLNNTAALPFFNKRVEEYYNCLWAYREGVFDAPFLRAVPQAFHEELLFDICQELFDKSYLFNNLDPAFLRAVSNIVTIALYNPNMVLCNTGKFSDKLFYILQGECQAMSKLRPANPAAIIRAGSIIGEVNLLFSFPYTTTVETRTCCQFIILKKYDLLEIIDKFPAELEVLKSRTLSKMQQIYETHQAFGFDPICWVKMRPENPGNPTASKFRRTIRRASGISRKMSDGDVVDDSDVTVIFHTPCLDKAVIKNHLIPYVTCAIPEILNNDVGWITMWNYFIMAVSLWFAFFGPYCLVFPESTKLDHYIFRTQFYLNKIISVIYVIDVFVEILGACPVSGWYYKFWDGLTVVRSQSTFYLDILAALPLDSFTPEDQNLLHVLGILFKVCKLWKVIRFLKYLDNVHPLQLFWFRLGQTITVLLYGIHFIACILYNLACPFNSEKKGVSCKEQSWLASYEIHFRMNNKPNEEVPTLYRINTLGYENPYLYSFFYSATTLTSAGFGDFNPQTKPEMLWSIGFQLFGFFLTGYYTALLTSALSCLMRPKLVIQNHLVSLRQFLRHYGVKEHIKDRIVEYFVLQHQLRGGVSMERGVHLMYDAPTYLRDDILYLEVCNLLDGVPVFTKIDSEIIIKLSSLMTRSLIPPNTTFVHKGEVRRILYIIKQGSMGIFEEGLENPLSLLQASSHFGIRDLLFGEPSHYTIRSLSYVTMYAVHLREFQEALIDDPELWDIVHTEKERIQHAIHEMTMIYSEMTKNNVPTSGNADRAHEIPSWIEIPRRVPAAVVAGDKTLEKINFLNDEYDAPFKGSRILGLVQLFLLRKTIHPVGYFSKFWNCVMSLVSSLTVIALMLETFCYIRMPGFRVFQMCLDWVNYMDIYLKLHWSYYNLSNGLLITHPLKTAVNYAFHGSLALDVATCAPVEFLLWVFGLTTILGYGKAASWYTRLRWIRFFQFKRIPIVYNIVHNVFKRRNVILLTLYVTSTLLVCTLVSAVAQFIACPWEANNWQDGDEYRLPICLKTGWVSTKYAEADTDPAIISGVIRRWVLGLYYVSQVILVIGFGDMVTLEQADIVMLMFMCIFGLIFMRCIVADMTAAEVDSDEARATFTETMNVLDLVMKRETVPKKLAAEVMSHLRYTWSRSRGLQPRELFGELHPVLQSELYKDLVGDKLQKVPIFRMFSPTVVRSICRYMKTQYIRRGERIMRFGNLEHQLCVIITGKVFITDKNLNYLCSLGPGDSFGESSLIYGLARRHNAIAATNVEIYTLSAARFKNFITCYPSFKEDIKANLNLERRDYFEKIIEQKMERARLLSGEKKQKILDSFAYRSNIVKNIVAHKEDLELSGLKGKDEQLHKRSIFFGYGDLDDHLPLIYICQKASTKKRRRCRCPCPVLHPNCLLLRWFLTMITWLCFFTPAIAAYEVCFSNEYLSSQKMNDVQSDSFLISKKLHVLSKMIEWIFLFYIFLQFFIAYQLKPGVYLKSCKSIILRYVTAPIGLAYDLLGCSPFILEMVFEAMEIDTTTLSPVLQSMLENLYLIRSVRLYYYYKNQLSKKDDLDVSTFRLQITLSVTSFVLMAHMLACLFYVISPCKRPDITNTTYKFSNLCPPPLDDRLDQNRWTTEYVMVMGIMIDKKLLEAWRWWFRSLYWVVTTISTTGFGDIVPVSIKEMVVGIICIFCGAFILSIILSQFTSGMASLTRAKREYMYQVHLLVKHLKNIGLSKIRQSQIMMYFLTMWERSRGIPYHKTMVKLPLCMRIEVAYALFGSTLNKVPFFHDNSDQILIRQISHRVIHSLYIPGTFIHKDGDPGSNLLVVYKGLVSGTLRLPNGEPDLKSIYNPGDAFGRFAAFFNKGTYQKSYRAETMVEVLEVRQKDIIHLAKRFPRFHRLLYAFMKAKYDMRTNNSIFHRKRRGAQVFGVTDDLQMAKAVKAALKDMHRKQKQEKKTPRKSKDKDKIIEEIIKA